MPLLPLFSILYKIRVNRARAETPALGPTHFKYICYTLSKWLYSKSFKNYCTQSKFYKENMLCSRIKKFKFRGGVYKFWILERNANLSEFFQRVLCNRTPRADRCFRLVNTCSHYLCYIWELTTFQSILFEFWNKKLLYTLEICIRQAFSESLERLCML